MRHHHQRNVRYNESLSGLVRRDRGIGIGCLRRIHESLPAWVRPEVYHHATRLLLGERPGHVQTQGMALDERHGIRRGGGRLAMVVAVWSCPSLCPSNRVARRVRGGRHGRGGRCELARCHCVDWVDGWGRTHNPSVAGSIPAGPTDKNLIRGLTGCAGARHTERVGSRR
jgi:hypothetical protein